MTKGSIVKLVTSFGSRWGRIRAEGDSRDVFFNAASLEDSAEFDTMSVGQNVEFDEEPDLANGVHAINIAIRHQPALA